MSNNQKSYYIFWLSVTLFSIGILILISQPLLFMPGPKSIDRKTKRGLFFEKYNPQVYKYKEDLYRLGTLLLKEQENLPQGITINCHPESISTLDISPIRQDSLSFLFSKIPNNLIEKIRVEEQISIQLTEQNRYAYFETFHYLYFGRKLETSQAFKGLLETQMKYKKIEESMYYLIYIEPDYG